MITAAHCLPKAPETSRWMEETVYPKLIGPRGAEAASIMLGEFKLTRPSDAEITAECVFADPVSDLAVLGPPDGQEFFDACTAYENFTAALPPFDIAAPPPRSLLRMEGIGAAPSFMPHQVSFAARVLSLDGKWLDCTGTNHGGPLWVEPEGIVVGGMSGSPLISVTGAALGVLSINDLATCLVDGLPGWLLRRLACG